MSVRDLPGDYLNENEISCNSEYLQPQCPPEWHIPEVNEAILFPFRVSEYSIAKTDETHVKISAAFKRHG